MAASLASESFGDSTRNADKNYGRAYGAVVIASKEITTRASLYGVRKGRPAVRFPESPDHSGLSGGSPSHARRCLAAAGSVLPARLPPATCADQSGPRPSCRASDRTRCDAIQRDVERREVSTVREPRQLASDVRPEIFRRPSVAMNRLPGFTSRRTMPLSCAARSSETRAVRACRARVRRRRLQPGVAVAGTGRAAAVVRKRRARRVHGSNDRFFHVGRA